MPVEIVNREAEGVQDEPGRLVDGVHRAVPERDVRLVEAVDRLFEQERTETVRRGGAADRRGARPSGPRDPRCSGAAAARAEEEDASAQTKSGPMRSCFTSSIEGGLHALVLVAEELDRPAHDEDASGDAERGARPSGA